MPAGRRRYQASLTIGFSSHDEVTKRLQRPNLGAPFAAFQSHHETIVNGTGVRGLA